MSFNLTEYRKKAKAVLKDAIQSAVFIDENALEPFKRITKNGSPDLIETQKLSKSIYQHFNRKNITLDIHKFSSVMNAKQKIRNKDIVLLDWHLEGEHSGERKALELLEEIVNEEHIHFCCIYTNSPKESVINNCVTYFSGYTQQMCNLICEEYELENELKELVDPFLDIIFALPNPNKLDIIGKDILRLCRNHNLIQRMNQLESLNDVTPLNKKLSCLSYATKTALNKADHNTPTIDFLNRREFVFTIKNTVVIILNKSRQHDSRALYSKILNEIIKKHNSYLLMLGLEMQSYINRSCAFITGDILDVDNQTIACHWNQNIKNNNEISFEEFVKRILVDQVDSKIKLGKFNLLKKDNFLNKNNASVKIDKKQVARINSFYNGSKIVGERLLNYGDIFFSPIKKKYYLCITALCDCLHPENINNRFFFVRGIKINIGNAIKLGDEAFISYINEDECINWVQSGPLTDEDNNKPVYVKPIQLYVPNSIIKNNIVIVFDWNIDEKETIMLEYKFTLRSQYAQRISNHAFSHPLRVGIDFMKISKK